MLKSAGGDSDQQDQKTAKMNYGFYDVVKLLGKGTYGKVNLCVKTHNRQKIVVKEIDFSTNNERLQNCKLEVSVMRSLTHPNIIRYYDSFTRNGVFYILMEYASQGTLHNLLYKSRPQLLEPQQVVNFFCQILMGLDHIHSKNIIHRDLKSENIFVTGIKTDVLKIGDFGISTILTTNGKCDTFIGTMQYMSPEMHEGKPYDMKSDIWALGCILYEMCALERLFTDKPGQVYIQMKSGNKKTIDVYRYGQQLQTLMDEMLNWDPDGRPDTIKLMTYPDIFPTLHILGADLGCI